MQAIAQSVKAIGPYANVPAMVQYATEPATMLIQVVQLQQLEGNTLMCRQQC